MSAPEVSLSRLRQRLEELGTIGRDPGGGLTRLPFSPAHTEAVRATARMMQQAGMTVGVDDFGILVGRLAGRGGDRSPPLVVGSHLDTVPGGGMFDGAYGVIAGIECAEALRGSDRGIRRPLVVLAFPEEEGYLFGTGTLASRALVGELPRSRFAELRDPAGRSLDSYLAERAHGLPPARVPASITAYLEPHVEQGPVLERLGRSVAAVDRITALTRSTVTVRGRRSHAGTTPMAERADALVAAAELIVAIRDSALATGGRAVGTVGTLEVSPGAPNVVPGLVRMSVELRSPDGEALEALRRAVTARAAQVAARTGIGVAFSAWSESPVQPMDPRVIEAIVASMAHLGHAPTVLPSWAGHDAAVLARYAPAGMIFVASTRGISHAPEEATPWPAAAAGAQVLLETLLRLDRSELPGVTLPLAYP